MKTKYKKIFFTLLMTFLLILIVITTLLSKDVLIAYENELKNENNLNERLENSEENSFGKWLVKMMREIGLTTAIGSEVEVESETVSTADRVIDVTYATVTNGYDWGPAIDKIVLNVGVSVDSSTVASDDFLVKSIRTLATEHSVVRKVIKAYTSDANGEASTDSQYIALEFEVGPEMPESAPFNYNFITGRNDYVKTAYEIGLVSDSRLASNDGTALKFIPTDYENFTDDIQPLSDRFVHNQTFERDHVALKFASFTPVKKTEAKIPLIIWLHGAGEGGLDTTIAVLGNNVTNLIKEETQSYFGDNGAYVLVPQSPTMWMDLDGNNVYNITVAGSDGQSFYADALMGLIERFVAEHPDLDKDRIYIGGCSNGGYMTVKMIIDHPNYFAAAYPAAEAYSVNWLTQDRINAIKDFPIWLTHAQNDPTVRISEDVTADGKFIPLDDYSNALYDRLVAAGNENVYYSLFDNVVDTSGAYTGAGGKPYEYNGHWSWLYTLNNTCTQTIKGKSMTLFEWLSEQRR